MQAIMQRNKTTNFYSMQDAHILNAFQQIQGCFTNNNFTIYLKYFFDVEITYMTFLKTIQKLHFLYKSTANEISNKVFYRFEKS